MRTTKTENLISKISKALNTHIQVKSIKSLVDDGQIQTIEIVSSQFSEMGDSFRSDLVFTILDQECPKVLQKFDITFCLLTEEEDLKFNSPLPKGF